MQVLDRIDEEEIRRLLDVDEFFWLDLESPSPDGLTTLARLLKLHPMALEDSREFGQRPKIDEYEDKVLLVFWAVQDGSTVEVHLHVSGACVVSVRRGPCVALASARRRLEADAYRTEEEAVYRLLDAMTDSFFPLVEHLEEEVDQVEDNVIAQPTAEQLRQLYVLRREVAPLRRRVAEQRDTMAAAGDLIGRLPGFEADVAHDYFRDVYDHLIRIVDDIDLLRDRLTAAMELHLSNQSNRLNQVIKQLTVIATIFLPLSFVTGFFGQNFGWLVDHVDTLYDFLVLGVGGLVLACVVLGAYFWRAGFFGR